MVISLVSALSVTFGGYRMQWLILAVVLLPVEGMADLEEMVEMVQQAGVIHSSFATCFISSVAKPILAEFG